MALKIFGLVPPIRLVFIGPFCMLRVRNCGDFHFTLIDNELFIVAAAVLLAFSLPKGYEAKQAEVDKVLAILSGKAKEIYTKVEEVVFKKIPKGSPKKSE